MYLQQKVDDIEKENEKQKNKQDLCLKLMKKTMNDDVIIEYIETIDFFESDDYQELSDAMDDFDCPNLSFCITFTFICLGPVLWLFMSLIEKTYEMIYLRIISAFIGARAIEAIWTYYLKGKKLHKEKVKEKNRNTAFVLPLVIISMIMVFIFTIGIDAFYKTYFLPVDFLFYQFSHISEITLMILTFAVFVILMSYLSNQFGLQNIGDFSYSYRFINKLPRIVRCAMVIVIGMAYYVCLSSFCVVTQTKIIYHSPLNPAGIVYEYQDVESVDARIKRGLLNYQINVDEHSFVFSQPTTNGDQRYDDTYIELEDFDQSLMDHDIKKTSSLKGIDNVHMDQKYIDRFIRIIHYQ